MKSKFEIKKLGDLIEEVSVRNRKKNVSEVFSVTNSQGFIKSTDYFDKEVFSKNTSNYKIVKQNQFAYNPSRINVGSIALLKENIEVAISPLYVVFQCRKDLLPEYLLNFLRSPIGNLRIRSKTRGAVRDNLTFNRLSEISIPLPSISEQRKIVQLISKTEILIEKRNKTIELIQDLLRSSFNAKFGGTQLNINKWEKDKIGNVCKVTKLAGFEYTKYIEYADKGEIIVVRALNVKDGKIKLNDVKYIERKTSDILERSKLFKDDVVITYIGSNIGDVAIINENDKYHLAPNVAKITVLNSKKLNPTYLLYYLMFNRWLFTKYTTNTAKQALNMNNIREVEILIPDIKIQKQFVKAVEKIEKQKQKLQLSFSILNKIHSSISSSAFQGELDLSNIEIDHIVPRMDSGSDADENIDIVTKFENRKIANKKGNILKAIVNKHFKTQPFNFEDLAEKVQASLVNEEYDYNKIKQEVFNSLRGNGEILLKQVFDENEKKLLLQTAK